MKFHRPFVSIFLIISSIALVACSPEEDASSQKEVIRPAKVHKVAMSESTLKRSYSAIVLPAQEVDHTFRVSGRIVELPIRSGQNVKKDDVIAVLDKRDFETEINRVNSQLEQARAQLKALTSGARVEDIAALEAAVRAAEAQVEAAQDQLARSEDLFKRKVIAKANVDRDQTALRVSEADLEAKRQELAKGKAGARAEDVQAQEAAIRGLESNLKSLNDNLEDATLRAPFDGMIAVRNVENFTNVQAKEPIAVLQALASPNLRFDVPAADVPAFAKAPSLGLTVVLDSLPDTEFTAKTSEFTPRADAATQTYRGRVSIENPTSEPILPGMTGILTVTAGGETTSEILIPVSALAANTDGSAFVWVVSNDNKVSKRPVVTGDARANLVTIKEGLAEGELIVVAGLSALQDSQTIKPITIVGD